MKIIIKKNWNVLWEAQPEQWKSILDVSWDMIPKSCWMGLCMLCLCEIEKWEEFIRKDTTYWPIEDWMCLACVSYVDDPEQEWEIVLNVLN